MERNAHYAAVGLATLVLFAGLILFIVWLARFQFARDYDIYDIHFFGPVRGLSEGGEVHFNGIRVGEVTDLNLDVKNPNKVIARVRMTSDVPVKVDSVAQLEPQGITGINYIQISAGSPGRALLKAGKPDDAIPVIQSQESAFSELLSGGGTVLAKAVEALDRVNRVLSDENVQSFSSTLENVEVVTAEMRAQREMLVEARLAIRNAGEAAAEARELMKSSRALVEGDGAQAMAKVEQAAAQTEKAATDLSTMIAKLEGPTSEFATTGLPQLSTAIGSVQEAADSLNRLLEEANRSPRGLLAKQPSKEVEVPR